MSEGSAGASRFDSSVGAVALSRGERRGSCVGACWGESPELSSCRFSKSILGV